MASASASPTAATFLYHTWETSPTIEEGHRNENKLERHPPRALKKSDKQMQCRLRTDRVLRRNIIIGACVASFLFMALLGFGVGLLAA